MDLVVVVVAVAVELRAALVGGAGPGRLAGAEAVAVVVGEDRDLDPLVHSRTGKEPALRACLSGSPSSVGTRLQAPDASNSHPW